MPRIGRIAAFLVPTFVLSWGFHLLVTTTIGHDGYLALGVSPLDMLFPAFVALVLRLFVLGDSPIHVRRESGRPRWMLYGFLVLAVVYGIVTLVGIATQNRSAAFWGVSAVLMTLWTLLVLFLGGQCSKEELRLAGLQLGNTDRAVRLVLGVIVFFALQAGLNLLLGLGAPPGEYRQLYGISVPSGLYPLGLVVAFGLAVIGIPLSGLAATFGEEYGWRGYLQDELSPLGHRRSALLVGLIWGVWHVPVIMGGMHTYPPTALGLALGVVFFVLWGVVQSYAVLKTDSIWVAAFLHGLVNSLYGFVLEYVVYPDDKILSFGLGLYGLACLAVVAFLLLRDSVWDSEPRTSRRGSAAP